jgi:hypothetical protein
MAHRISSFLSAQFRKMYRPHELSVEAAAVIRVLNKAGVKFVLMGAHAIGGWTKAPRATQDVDVLVQKSHYRKAVKALQQAYKDLVIKQLDIVTRFIDPQSGLQIIDVVRPYHTLDHYALKHSIPVGKTHRVPDLETAIASKFAAMISLTREVQKRLQDAADMAGIIAHNAADLDRGKLEELGETVYTGGGKELLEHVDAVLAGRPVNI